MPYKSAFPFNFEDVSGIRTSFFYLNMIRTDLERRWAEIKFYYFCLDVYHIRNDMLDVAMVIEAIAQVGAPKKKELKFISGKILGDTHYLPTRDELIIMCKKYDIPVKKIQEYTGVSRGVIYYTLKNKKENYYPHPYLTVAEDEILIKFLDTLEFLRKAGIT